MSLDSPVAFDFAAIVPEIVAASACKGRFEELLLEWSGLAGWMCARDHSLMRRCVAQNWSAPIAFGNGILSTLSPSTAWLFIKRVWNRFAYLSRKATGITL